MNGPFLLLTWRGKEKGAKNNIVPHYNSTKAFVLKALYHVKEFKREKMLFYEIRHVKGKQMLFLHKA